MTHTNHKNFYIYTAILMLCILLAACYDSSFFNAHQLMSSDLNRGDEVEIGWSPNRMVRLEYQDGSRYAVLESHNSKMLPGDSFSLP